MQDILSRLAAVTMSLAALASSPSLLAAGDKDDRDRLPAAVAKAIEENRPGAEIDKLDVEKESGITLYDIEFKAGRGEMDVTADGTVLDVTSLVELKDVPEPVAAVIRKAAQSGSIKQVEKAEIRARIQKDGGKSRVVMLASPEYVYAAELAKGEIEVAADGTILKAPKGMEKESFLQTFDVDGAELVTTGENPYFMLKPGYELTLRGKEGGRNVQLVIAVLSETKSVGGIQTRVVEERETSDGVPLEISRNYFAISPRTHDVFYFGEDVDTYKHGKIKDHDGGWQHGTANARFGLMMPGAPRAGSRYFQEQAPGVAMDRAEIVSLDESASVAAGRFERCLRVKETTPLEMFAKEYKLYAPGVGLIRDGSLELVSRVTPPSEP